ncbi:hypothetical protein I4U23_011022 [Adineta vaga]|nr:hypothetical protein I4U23_011022 [Adineta vaga]
MEKMQIEDFANEIFYEIFEYLDHFQSYEVFFNLNQRFRSLFMNLIYPKNIHLGSMSKSTFTSYYENQILPNSHQIQSLHLSNPFLIQFFFSSTSLIAKFIHLQRLIVNDIPSKYLTNLFDDLSILMNLSSLSITYKYSIEKSIYIYKKLFQLPSLKYCELTTCKCNTDEYLPIEIQQISHSLTHLILNGITKINDLVIFLSVAPHLHHLSIDRLSDRHQSLTINSIIPNQLTHIYLNNSGVFFNVLETLIKYVFHHAQVLHISALANQSYLNANRWELLIPVYMPYLQKFHMDLHGYCPKITVKGYLNLIKQFQSSFWFEHQWFFAYYMKEAGDSCEIYFYSTDPYRYDLFYSLI